MPQTAESASSSTSQSFAGLLAALATPSQKRTPDWNDDGLAEDVATLSYETALRANARYRPSEAMDTAATQSTNTRAIRDRQGVEAAVMAARQKAIEKLAEQESGEEFATPEPKAAYGDSKQQDKNLKCASITIRLSQAEGAQLRKRAAEADLTVSAYLRSCAFEVESLRAQVKETVAQLRAGEAQSKPPVSVPAPAKRSWLHWPSRA
jgi:selenocysteine lyase/cysteine desulfurase